MSDTLHKTLIIRFSSVGDIVLSSLLLRTFHARFPDCHIDYCVKEEFADLVRFHPAVDDVIEFPAGGRFRDLQLLRGRIRRAGYDLVIDIHDSLRSRYLCAGAKRVVRIKKRKLARFLLVTFKWHAYDRFGGAPGVALRYLEPVRQFGVADDGEGLEVFLNGAGQDRTPGIMREEGFAPDIRFIGICPSAKHNNKMWLKERFAGAAAAAGTEHGCAVALFGSENERHRCSEIAALVHAIKPETRVLNLAGRLSLNETAAMMDRCSLVITNDSGLMHVAAARKRPVVAVFGPTVREFGFFPFRTRSIVVETAGLPCRPCTHIGLPECPKGHFKCMNQISQEDVIAAANTLLHPLPQ